MKHVFTQVTVKTLKQNRTRTAVTIIGILLATAMLTAVTTFVSSLQHFMIASVIAEEGNWHGAITEMSAPAYKELAKSDQVEASSYYQEVGYARLSEITSELAEDGKPYLYVTGITDAFCEMLPVTVSVGRLPENSSEITLPRHLMTTGTVELQIGDTFTLELGKRDLNGERLGIFNPVIWQADGQTAAETFVPREVRTYTLVGIIDRPVFEDYSSAAYFAVTKADAEPEAGSTFMAYYRMKRPGNVYAFTNAHQGHGSATWNSTLLRYLGSSTNRPFMQMLYGLAAILMLLIMTGGISLVYNSFAISVSDRTRQFGLLASVGATPRQLRSMVRKEALLVSAVGIPLGILSGIAGIGMTLYLLGDSFQYLYAGKVPMRLWVSWPAVLISGLTALLTVLISAWIPQRRAAKVSPMEAIRQTRDIQIPKRAARKGKWSYRLFGVEGMIAGKHFARSRRQYRATIFSLFISVVLFISASSFSSYVKRSVGMVEDVPDYDVAVYLDAEEVEEGSFSEEILQMSGVEEGLRTWSFNAGMTPREESLEESFLTFARENRKEEDCLVTASVGEFALNVQLMVLEDTDYEAYLKEQKLDASVPAVMLNTCKGYVSGEQRYRNFTIFKEQKLELPVTLIDYTARAEALGEAGEAIDETAYQKKMIIPVTAWVKEAPLNIYADCGGPCVVLSESTFRNLAPDADTYLQRETLYLKSAQHEKLTEQIEELALTKGQGANAYVIDEASYRQVQRSMLLTVDVFTYGFIVLISLIAVANVFNTISTGFLLRRREFAVLSSVGMTPKSLNKMLSYECLLYGTRALLLGLPASVLVTWMIYRVVQNSMDTGFYIPALSMLIAVCSVFLVVFATMVYAVTKMKQENVIDSIRKESL